MTRSTKSLVIGVGPEVWIGRALNGNDVVDKFTRRLFAALTDGVVASTLAGCLLTYPLGVARPACIVATLARASTLTIELTVAIVGGIGAGPLDEILGTAGAGTRTFWSGRQFSNGLRRGDAQPGDLDPHRSKKKFSRAGAQRIWFG